MEIPEMEMAPINLADSGKIESGHKIAKRLQTKEDPWNLEYIHNMELSNIDPTKYTTHYDTLTPKQRPYFIKGLFQQGLMTEVFYTKLQSKISPEILDFIKETAINPKTKGGQRKSMRRKRKSMQRKRKSTQRKRKSTQRKRK